MIRSFRHKGLAKFYRQGTTQGIQAKHARRLTILLASLEVARYPSDMWVPDFCLHRLKGQQARRWLVRVSQNWRLTFEIRDKKVFDVDYEDYH